ncbi:MAG: hypothetical protein HY899_01895 [Deltaproteobacteria bacterium]|nr:hypothetical protein [Deltaproteobacteria bacterium]
MPEDLWADAIAVAEAQGAYCASRELNVNYATLKRRTEREVHKAYMLALPPAGVNDLRVS